MDIMDINKIVKVYSGRSGCACGCRGKYSYNEGEDHSPDGTVNVRSVKLIANKVLKDPKVIYENNCAYTDDGNRLRFVVFKEGVELPAKD